MDGVHRTEVHNRRFRRTVYLIILEVCFKLHKMGIRAISTDRDHVGESTLIHPTAGLWRASDKYNAVRTALENATLGSTPLLRTEC